MPAGVLRQHVSEVHDPPRHPHQAAPWRGSNLGHLTHSRSFLMENWLLLSNHPAWNIVASHPVE
jgi:hypothetical protein